MHGLFHQSRFRGPNRGDMPLHVITVSFAEGVVWSGRWVTAPGRFLPCRMYVCSGFHRRGASSRDGLPGSSPPRLPRYTFCIYLMLSVFQKRGSVCNWELCPLVERIGCWGPRDTPAWGGECPGAPPSFPSIAKSVMSYCRSPPHSVVVLPMGVPYSAPRSGRA